MQEMHKVACSVYISQSAVTHAMTTELFKGIYGLPALTDDITDMIADKQMIGQWSLLFRGSLPETHDECQVIR